MEHVNILIYNYTLEFATQIKMCRGICVGHPDYHEGPLVSWEKGGKGPFVSQRATGPRKYPRTYHRYLKNKLTQFLLW